MTELWQVKFSIIHPEGRKYGVIAAAIALVPLFFGWQIIGWPLLLLSLGVLAFFRDPERVVPQDDNSIVAPADGLVTLIQTLEPPAEMLGNDGSGVPGLPRGPVTRVSIFMSVFDGLMIGFTQIAGLVARRIVPFVKPGDTVAKGQRVGLIRFGSRVDVYLPAGTEPKVLMGQRIVAGETILAEVGATALLEGIVQ